VAKEMTKNFYFTQRGNPYSYRDAKTQRKTLHFLYWT